MQDAVITIDLEAPYPGGEDGAVGYGDLFRRKDVQATFFVTGDVAERRPDLIERLLAQGHEIGSHGWRHPYVSDPLEKRSKYLPELPDDVLAEHLEKCVECLERQGSDPVGFRAMQFKTDARVMQQVAKRFRYDSSLTRRQIDAWPEPLPLPVLPVSTLRGTSVRIGTPVLFGPVARPLVPLMARAADGSPMVVYGHSFDLVERSSDIHTAAWKRWWYFDRCGEQAAGVLDGLIETVRKAGGRFLTARQAMGS